MLDTKSLVLRARIAFALTGCCAAASCGVDSTSGTVENPGLDGTVRTASAGETGPAGHASRVRSELPGELVRSPSGSGTGASDELRPGSPDTTVAAAPATSATPVADSLAPGVRGRITVRGAGLGGVGLSLDVADGAVLRATSSGGRSDQRGYFGFESVPPGEHTLRLELPDSSGVAFGDTTRTVRVDSRGARIRTDFRGRLARDSGIRGAVQDRRGEPVGGLRVAVTGHALEGYPTDLAPPLGALTWSDTVTTGPGGEYSLAVPAGWYRVSIWREEWLETARFLHFEYRSPMPAVAPRQTITRDLDLRRVSGDQCTAGHLAYGERLERDPGAMRCGEPLHPEVTRFELWAFDGSAGDEVEVEADLAAGSPLLLLGPDGTVLERMVGGEGERPTLSAVLERSGRHRIVVTYAGPVWSTADSYRLRLSGRSSRSALGPSAAETQRRDGAGEEGELRPRN